MVRIDGKNLPSERLLNVKGVFTPQPPLVRAEVVERDGAHCGVEQRVVRRLGVGLESIVGLCVVLWCTRRID